MEELKQSVKQLVAEELERANKKFPMFHSRHEGYAVIKEEVEEVKQDIEDIQDIIEWTWDNVKRNNTVLTDRYMIQLNALAIHLAAEAIQVAAMAQKYKDSFKGE